MSAIPEGREAQAKWFPQPIDYNAFLEKVFEISEMMTGGINESDAKRWELIFKHLKADNWTNGDMVVATKCIRENLRGLPYLADFIRYRHGIDDKDPTAPATKRP